MMVVIQKGGRCFKKVIFQCILSAYNIAFIRHDVDHRAKQAALLPLHIAV